MGPILSQTQKSQVWIGYRASTTGEEAAWEHSLHCVEDQDIFVCPVHKTYAIRTVRSVTPVSLLTVAVTGVEARLCIRWNRCWGQLCGWWLVYTDDFDTIDIHTNPGPPRGRDRRGHCPWARGHGGARGSELSGLAFKIHQLKLPHAEALMFFFFYFGPKFEHLRTL